jgi:hypothetical protein
VKLLISQYLRLLKERDELDALIPTLFQAMGIIPVSRPQTGVRQGGVDIAAVGPDPHDGQDKLFLVVVKRGNIGRSNWDSGPQSVRSSLNEIFDIYLHNNVHPEHRALPVSIWVCASGDLLQAVNENFSGYARSKESQAEIIFCGADRLSALIEQYLLNEDVFLGEDRNFLRKSLVLIGDTDYDLRDYHALLLSQLKISRDGAVSPQTETSFLAVLTRIHFALNILIAWGEDAENLKQPLEASERTLLWSWHAILKQDFRDNTKVWEKYAEIYTTYLKTALLYLKKASQYFNIKDGMSGVSSNSALIAVSIFRQIAILASVGVSAISQWETLEQMKPIIEWITDLLRAIIDNNHASSSPRLDENSIDINIAIIFFTIMGDIEFVKNWLRKLISKIVFTVRTKRNYPVSSDKLEDLAQVENETSDEGISMLKESWLIPSLAIWCVIFDMDNEYNYITQGIIKDNNDIDPQLWHPVVEAYDSFYFSESALDKGDTEVNIDFSGGILGTKERISNFKSSERYDVFHFSPALKKKLLGIELLACKHFRIPVPPALIYSYLTNSENSAE